MVGRIFRNVDVRICTAVIILAVFSAFSTYAQDDHIPVRTAVEVELKPLHLSFILDQFDLEHLNAKIQSHSVELKEKLWLRAFVSDPTIVAYLGDPNATYLKDPTNRVRQNLLDKALSLDLSKIPKRYVASLVSHFGEAGLVDNREPHSLQEYIKFKPGASSYLHDFDYIIDKDIFEFRTKDHIRETSRVLDSFEKLANDSGTYDLFYKSGAKYDGFMGSNFHIHFSFGGSEKMIKRVQSRLPQLNEWILLEALALRTDQDAALTELGARFETDVKTRGLIRWISDDHFEVRFPFDKPKEIIKRIHDLMKLSDEEFSREITARRTEIYANERLKIKKRITTKRPEILPQIESHLDFVPGSMEDHKNVSAKVLLDAINDPDLSSKARAVSAKALATHFFPLKDRAFIRDQVLEKIAAMDWSKTYSTSEFWTKLKEQTTLYREPFKSACNAELVRIVENGKFSVGYRLVALSLMSKDHAKALPFMRRDIRSNNEVIRARAIESFSYLPTIELQDQKLLIEIISGSDTDSNKYLAYDALRKHRISNDRLVQRVKSLRNHSSGISQEAAHGLLLKGELAKKQNTPLLLEGCLESKFIVD